MMAVVYGAQNNQQQQHYNNNSTTLRRRDTKRLHQAPQDGHLK